MLPSGRGERPQLAFNRLGCFQTRAYLYELLCAISIPDQEVDLKSVGGLHVAHFGPPPLELIEYRRFERVAQVRASACVEGWNESEALRTAVKAAELEAERIEQMTLELWGASHLETWPRVRPDTAVTANIAALLATHG